MHRDFEDLTYSENGPRWSAEGFLFGVKVTVATGYSGTTDDWPFHVYVQSPRIERLRLTEGSAFAARTKDESLYQGLTLASEYIRKQGSGFQKAVK